MGVVMVVTDRQADIQKAMHLLEQPTYWLMPLYLTNKLKTSLANILRKIKAETDTDNNTYRIMYPTGASSP